MTKKLFLLKKAFKIHESFTRKIPFKEKKFISCTLLDFLLHHGNHLGDHLELDEILRISLGIICGSEWKHAIKRNRTK